VLTALVVLALVLALALARAPQWLLVACWPCR
jgi:hypothetical protein